MGVHLLEGNVLLQLCVAVSARCVPSSLALLVCYMPSFGP